MGAGRSDGSRPGRRGRVRNVVRTAARLLLAGLLGYAVFCTLALMVVRVVDPPLTMVQLQRRWETNDVRRQHAVALERVSIHLQHAVVAAEDTRFYEHGGVDWQGLHDAVEDNLRRGRLWRGGSTITQQLVKNLFLITHSSFLRKGIELPLALLADRILPKRRILEIYLNVVEWGPGVFGAEAAARFHYGVSAAQLTREQSARLAACLPSPRRRTPQRMGRYASVIQRRMAVMGW
jgi:monofunctional biosynthetic peptidoglycan transglycosylase